MNEKVRGAGAEWNANLYDAKHDFVWKYGSDVVSLLDPRAVWRFVYSRERSRAFPVARAIAYKPPGEVRPLISPGRQLLTTRIR